jgi:hypothetical protein
MEKKTDYPRRIKFAVLNDFDYLKTEKKKQITINKLVKGLERHIKQAISEGY